MVVVTEVFANLAATAARARGMNELRTLVLPHPMETRTEDEIRHLARAAMSEIARLLTLDRNDGGSP
ncbi:MAG: hypothetical protein HY270_20225 [Deltaproteobacteria bacterium]|nr:hypothetical protein [Deltaproteobacteria bacterium]